MSGLFRALLMGGYAFVVLPAVLLLVMTLFDRSRDPEQPSRRRLLAFLALAALGLTLLGLLIWLNPYGSDVNSSLPAVGVLIVLDALLVYLLRCRPALARLWSTERALAASLAVLYTLLLIFVTLADPLALLLILLPTLVLTFILRLSRAGVLPLALLSLLALVVLVFTAGGWLYIPAADQPAWLQIARSLLMAAALLVCILLPAGLLHASLRASPQGRKIPLAWTLALSVVLLAGLAYQGFWEGIWSSAHARAFEDHLPINQFFLALVAGTLLALTLRGARKWSGPLYTVLVTTVAVLAFTRGWNVSAFELSGRRAAVVERAITSYSRDHGAYPDSLAALTPRYLLFLSPPVVVRTGGWCYQSTGDAYRLGYISGDFTYFTRRFKVETYARAGSLPETAWDCDDLRARFEAQELTY